MADFPIYFVTGASGFVGRHVCNQLIKSGFEVRAMIRSVDEELTTYGVKVWIGDLWNEDILHEAIADSDIIIHCAGDARFGNGTHYHHANVELTEYLIRVVKKNDINISRFVYISTIGAIDRSNGDYCIEPLTENSFAFPTSDYGKSKLESEKIVMNSDLPFSIIRPTMVVGSDMRNDSHFAVFAHQALTASLIARLAWPGRFSVIHVDDLASAILTVSEHHDAQGEVYFCAGESISISDFFHLCSPEKMRIPLWFIAYLMKLLIKWMPFTLKAMFFPALTASDSKLRSLGWSPNHSAQSALKEVIHREMSLIEPNISPGGQTVITGAASGLGRALAIYLSTRRERLLLVDKDGESLNALASDLGDCSIKVIDLASRREIKMLLESSEWNECDITELYACAGVGLKGQIQDISIDNHCKMFAINVLARIELARAAISTMQKRNFGRVVLISSSSAFQPLPNMATYAATNSALLSIGESWAEEVAGKNIQVHTVCPGGMQTNFQKSGGVKEVEGEKLMPPEAVVEEIMKGIRKQRKTIIVSFRSFAMSMLARTLPRNMSVKLWGRLMEKMR